MASIFGGIDIHQVSGGVVSFGDTYTISPKSAVKDPSGSGSNNVGAWVITSTGISYTNFFDPDVNDQPFDDEMAGAGTVGTVGTASTTGTAGATGTTGATGTNGLAE